MQVMHLHVLHRQGTSTKAALAPFGFVVLAICERKPIS